MLELAVGSAERFSPWGSWDQWRARVEKNLVEVCRCGDTERGYNRGCICYNFSPQQTFAGWVEPWWDYRRNEISGCVI